VCHVRVNCVTFSRGRDEGVVVVKGTIGRRGGGEKPKNVSNNYALTRHNSLPGRKACPLLLHGNKFADEIKHNVKYASL